MKTLIIYAHPSTPGYCPTILKEVETKLKSTNEEYELLDLYKMNYNPILSEKEHYTAGFYDISKKNKVIQKKILDAKNLIFIYPVWWGSMPAILKGFFDRILTSHYAFQYSKNGSRVNGLLKGRNATVFITSGGPKIFTLLASPAFVIKFNILKFCGIKSKINIIGKCRKFDEARVPEIKKMVEKGLKFLF